MQPSGDPFAGAHDEGNGVPLLRQAFAQLASGAFGAAVSLATEARAVGIPTESVPHAAVLEGVGRVQSGDLPTAVDLLSDAWRNHPDFAALPVALGIALRATGEHAAASRTLLAAALSEDPDQSIDSWRGLLTRGLVDG